MLKYALKYRSKHTAQTVPQRFQHIAETLKVKAQCIHSVNDSGCQTFKGRLYLFPDGKNAVFEVLIGVP